MRVGHFRLPSNTLNDPVGNVLAQVVVASEDSADLPERPPELVRSGTKPSAPAFNALRTTLSRLYVLRSPPGQAVRRLKCWPVWLITPSPLKPGIEIFHTTSGHQRAYAERPPPSEACPTTHIGLGVNMPASSRMGMIIGQNDGNLLLILLWGRHSALPD